MAANGRGEERSLTLSRWTVADVHGDWPCGLCQSSFPVAQSWHLTVRDGPTATSEIVCPACAQRLRHPAGKVGAGIRIRWGSVWLDEDAS